MQKFPENPQRLPTGELAIDYSVVKLKFKNKGKVEGIYNYIPFEKDAGYGSFVGYINSDGEIKSKYTRTMEGVTNTIDQKFKINDDKLIIYHNYLNEWTSMDTLKMVSCDNKEFNSKIKSSVIPKITQIDS